MLEKRINELKAAYPEQIRLIDEVADCANSARYGLFDDEEALATVHEIDNLLEELWEVVYNENFDDRDLTDKEFANVITDIKDKVARLESVINDYREDLIIKFDLNIA